MERTREQIYLRIKRFKLKQIVLRIKRLKSKDPIANAKLIKELRKKLRNLKNEIYN